MVTGGSFGGLCLSTPPDTPEKTLASHTSPPLVEDVTVTNKVSQNLHAELLLHHLGKSAFCGDGSTVSGARLVRAFLENAGIDKDDFVFLDGSGLSGHDLVTPRATVRLLQYASTQPWFEGWKKSTPASGRHSRLRSPIGSLFKFASWLATCPRCGARRRPHRWTVNRSSGSWSSGLR